MIRRIGARKQRLHGDELGLVRTRSLGGSAQPMQELVPRLLRVGDTRVKVDGAREEAKQLVGSDQLRSIDRAKEIEVNGRQAPLSTTVSPP